MLHEGDDDEDDVRLLLCTTDATSNNVPAKKRTQHTQNKNKTSGKRASTITTTSMRGVVRKAKGSRKSKGVSSFAL
jgi:hypothetical protein